MSTLYLDTETASDVGIQRGLPHYMTHVRLLCCAWCVDGALVQIWDAASPLPAALAQALKSADEVWAHNAVFDREVWRRCVLEAPVLDEQWRDSMALASYNDLPASLSELCRALGLPSDKTKDRRGAALIRRFCVPNAPHTRESDRVGWAELLAYCKQDVVAMRECIERIEQLTGSRRYELKLWRETDAMNRRGLPIDLALARWALKLRESALENANAHMGELTDGCVSSVAQVGKLKNWINSNGYATNSVARSALSKAPSSLPENVKAALRLRENASQSSGTKLATLLERQKDGRAHNTIVYCGASRTGRDAHRGFQPGNLPRVPPHVQQQCVEAFLHGRDVDGFDAAKAVLRAVICPGEGRSIVAVDLSAIEGRVCAWLCNDQALLSAYQAYDAGGPDPYKATYATAFNTSATLVTKSQRMIGKVMSLYLQYGGGVGAYVRGAKALGIDLEAMADGVEIDPTLCMAGRYAIGDCADLGVSERVIRACDALKTRWRKAHAAIEATWHALMRAMETAATGGVARAARCELRFCKGDALRGMPSHVALKLPSGRCLRYWNTRFDSASQTLVCEGSTSLWGGLLLENITQAVARDVFMEGVMRAARAGLKTLLRVHDELVVEADAKDAAATLQTLAAALTTAPKWAPGLPLAAAGFVSDRYRKG